MLNLLPFQLTEIPNIHDDTNEILLKGTYPALFEREIPSLTFYRNYVKTFVERDVRQLKNIKDLSSFQKLLTLLAGRSRANF